jgi:peptidyl-prolyl cis-trans isomerase A (cyclophilin A)
MLKQALLAVLLTSAALAQTAMKSTGAPATKSTAAPKAAVPAAPAADLLHPATLNRTAPPVYRVKFATSKGDIVIEVTRAWAPRGADRFYNLVRANYFTDVAFFRVIPGFMAQFGISSKPEVAAAWVKADVTDDPVKQSNTRGKLTFATSGPNSRTTQLFINTANNANLDSQGFSPIGEVIEGMSAADMLYSGYGGNPDQGAIQTSGKAWLDRNMPKVDKILTATIVPIPATGAAVAPGTPAPGVLAPKPAVPATPAAPKQ